MTTLNLNDDLLAAVRQIAAQQHTTPERVINNALADLIEDWQDAQAAEAVLKRIENGEATYTLDEVRLYLDALDD